jgi:hypothetical protein
MCVLASKRKTQRSVKNCHKCEARFSVRMRSTRHQDAPKPQVSRSSKRCFRQMGAIFSILSKDAGLFHENEAGGEYQNSMWDIGTANCRERHITDSLFRL